jgi:hypothetical protein
MQLYIFVDRIAKVLDLAAVVEAELASMLAGLEPGRKPGWK